LTAAPDSGWNFIGWSGDVTDTLNPVSVTITGNMIVTANYSIVTFTLTYNAGTGGTISGTTPQTVNYGTDGTPVTAMPNTGYHFVDWSDGVLTASRTDTNITADLTVTAHFAINVNNPPTFTSAPVIAATVGSVYTYNVTTSDPEGDARAITAPTKPAWLTLTDNLDGTATLTGTPTAANFGANAVTLSVSDGVNPAVIQNFSITVSSASPFTVTFDANGGTGTMAPQINNGPTALMLNTFTRTGYTFAGWNTVALGGGTAYTDGQVYPFTADVTLYAQWTVLPTLTMTFRSTGSQDGWILESSENSGIGGTLNNIDKTFNLGDDAENKQYRAILSFNTTNLPETLTIKSVTLKIKKAGLFGANPFTKLGALTVDIRRGTFGTSALQLTDFQAKPNKAAVGYFKKTPSLNWYTAILKSTSYAFINRTGLTQFRLRFAMDDNNNRIADYMRFFSGNTGATSRPVLIIQYTEP
jgi:uncharacterized repeat protein (TIGR02543 family)